MSSPLMCARRAGIQFPSAVLAALLVSCASIRPVPLPAEAEVHHVKTDDGWTLEMVRYRAVGEPRGLPVLMVHGIASNGRGIDVDAEHSMVRWFAKQGYESWTLSLRATGGSDRPDPSAGRPDGVNFDDFWRHDLPAAINEVLTVSHAEKLNYIGHSMGGITVYAYLSQGGKGINAAATLGSPTRMDFGQVATTFLADFTNSAISKNWLVPAALGASIAAPFQPTMDDGPFQRLFWNPESSRVETWQRLMASGVADVSGGVGHQLLRMVKTGQLLSADESIDYRKAMAGIRVPVLVVAAKLDRIAPTPGVKDAFRLLGGPKQWLLITRANGAAGEYGHMDLLISERAADEVWSKVLTFFSKSPQSQGSHDAESSSLEKVEVGEVHASLSSAEDDR